MNSLLSCSFHLFCLNLKDVLPFPLLLQRDNLRIGLDDLMNRSFSPSIQADQYEVTFLPVANSPPRTARYVGSEATYTPTQVACPKTPRLPKSWTAT